MLYLRYTTPPKQLWGWLEPFLEASGPGAAGYSDKRGDIDTDDAALEPPAQVFAASCSMFDKVVPFSSSSLRGCVYLSLPLRAIHVLLPLHVLRTRNFLIHP